MNALLTGIIGVAATLLGPFSTYLFQGRAAKRAEAVARAERLHQEQLSASTAFAAAVTELKRGLVTLWFYKQTGQDGLIIRRPEWNAIAWGPTRKLPDSGCSLFPATLGS